MEGFVILHRTLNRKNTAFKLKLSVVIQTLPLPLFPISLPIVKLLILSDRTGCLERIQRIHNGMSFKTELINKSVIHDLPGS